MDEKKEISLQVFIHRSGLCLEPYIEIKKEGFTDHNMWVISMDRDVRKFSTEELRAILKKAKGILRNMHPWEIPLDFHDIVGALEYVLNDTGIFVTFVTKEEEMFFRKMGVPEVDKLLQK